MHPCQAGVVLVPTLCLDILVHGLLDNITQQKAKETWMGSLEKEGTADHGSALVLKMTGSLKNMDGCVLCKQQKLSAPSSSISKIQESLCFLPAAWGGTVPSLPELHNTKSRDEPSTLKIIPDNVSESVLTHQSAVGLCGPQTLT